jgi:hypothetical protein
VSDLRTCQHCGYTQDFTLCQFWNSKFLCKRCQRANEIDKSGGATVTSLETIQTLLNELSYEEFCQVVAVMGSQLEDGIKVIVPMPEGKQAIVYSRTDSPSNIARIMGNINSSESGTWRIR